MDYSLLLAVELLECQRQTKRKMHFSDWLMSSMATNDYDVSDLDISALPNMTQSVDSQQDEIPISITSESTNNIIRKNSVNILKTESG